LKTSKATSDSDVPNIITNRAANEIIHSLHRVKIVIEDLVTDTRTSALATFALSGIAVELDHTMHAVERFRVKYQDGSGGPPNDDQEDNPAKKERTPAPKCPKTGKRHRYSDAGACECGAKNRKWVPAPPPDPSVIP